MGQNFTNREAVCRQNLWFGGLCDSAPGHRVDKKLRPVTAVVESVQLMNMEVISLKRPWPSRLESVYDDNDEVNGALMVKFPKSKVRFNFFVSVIPTT